MAKLRHREEAINVKLADALANRGLNADAESIHLKGRPDVLVELGGLKLVLEGRHEKEVKSLKADARDRVKKGLGEISLALSYPDDLFTTNTTQLTAALEHTAFDGSVFYYSGSDIHESVFESSSIDDIADLIRNVFGLIVQDDVVRSQVEKVELAIDRSVAIARKTNLFFKSETVKKRLKAALAIDD